MGLIRRPGDVAFRLVHELEGMLDGIRADGEIHGEEVDRLERWLAENQQFADVDPFKEMAAAVEHALADRVLTLDEVEDLLFVTQKLTTVNPYFDTLRTGVQVLMGTLAGVAADGMVKPVEIDHLQKWIEDWGHLKGLWPYDECESVVTSILSRREMGADARAIMALASSFPVAGDVAPVDAAQLTAVGLCAVDPDVRFDGRSFVFTGDSKKCDRAQLAGHVERRGGVHHPKVRKDTHYLIVCDGGSQYWAFSCYGRKVEQAMRYRKDGCPVVIVHERDFWDAVA